jgi:penicillin-binding protein 1C
MKPLRKLLVSALLASLLILAGTLVFIFHDLPSVDSLPARLNQPSIRITDRHGNLLYEVLPAEGGRHAVLPLADIPNCMKQATIAIEDRNFYQNPGVDLEGVARAIWINLQGGETIAGGSTITQQVARNLLLGPERSERSLRRKLREIVLAWQMSRRLSKDEILALYLNQTYYGGLTYGVEAAAQTYFGKPARDLLLPECTLLAGLPQAPGLYDPLTNPEKARERQLIVLGLMEKEGMISAEERRTAEITPLVYNPAPYPIQAAHFIWLVKARLDALYAEGRLDPRASLVVRTTLDLDYQRVAEEAVARRLKAFEPKPGRIDKNVNNAALAALDPRSGEVLALVGSADYFDASIQGAVNMAVSRRQPGSAFKPFLYAQTLDPNRPDPWTAATMLLDVRTTFMTHENQPYTPKNYDGREHGPVSVRQALASSLNIPAVLALEKAGIPETVHLAGRLGITSLGDPDEYDLSLALGGGQMSLLQLSNAYAAFANGGLYVPCSLLLEIHTADGALVYTETRPTPVQVFDPRVAWLINDILSDDRARTMGFGQNSTLKIERTAAVKTGTTTNFHDNWTIGYTPDLLVGVWVGNSNYQAMRDVNGLTGAAPIWQDVIRSLSRGLPDKPFPRPDGLTQMDICDLSGLLPVPACEHTRPEWFIPGTQPTEADNVYQQVWLDALTGAPADESTPFERRIQRTVLNLPMQAHAWARAHDLPLLADLPQSAAPAQGPALTLVSPRPNTTYHFTTAFDAAAQQLLVEAVAGPGVTQVTLWVDDRQLAACTSMPCQAWWPLSAGEHRFRAQGIDSNGQAVYGEVIAITVTGR